MIVSFPEVRVSYLEGGLISIELFSKCFLLAPLTTLESSWDCLEDVLDKRKMIWATADFCLTFEKVLY
jgi:hypothetical protein